MKTCLNRFIVSAFCAVLLWGCSREETREADKVRDISGESDSFVILKINGKPITMADYRRRLAFEKTIWKIRNSSRSVRAFEGALKNFLRMRQPEILSVLMNSALIYDEAERRNLLLNEKNVQTECARTLKSLNYSGNVTQFAKEFEFDQKYLERQICQRQQIFAVRDSVFPESGTVTDDEVAAKLRQLNEYYDFAVASNHVTWATCSNALQSVAAGLTLEAVGQKFGANVDDAERWAAFAPEEITNLEMREWAFSAPVGSVHEFDLDDGLSIVKIISREDGAMTASLAAEKEAEVILARINFVMLVTEPMPRKAENVRAGILELKQ